MNTKTLLSLNAMIAIVAVASIAMISNISEAPMVTADEEKAKGLYKMADATQIVGTFEFRDGVETVNIPDFVQTTGFTDTSRPTFEFKKIVGDTPLLHEAADVFQKFMSRDASYPHNFNDFEATIDIYHSGKHVRSLSYTDCKINDSVINTLEDKEEAYLGKGFAVIEEYEIECTGYIPHAIDYDTMLNGYKTHSKQLSSMDLLEQKSVWEAQQGIETTKKVESNPAKMNSLERIGDKATYTMHRNN